jgi:uncharacterized protein YcbX
MSARIAALFRHPVKGFTPEPLARATLTAGRAFPCDRLFAVEDGPSGFDRAAPAHISKTKFTVLAKIPAVARIITRYEDDIGVLRAKAGGREESFALKTQQGRAGFAAFVADMLGEDARGPLRVIEAPGDHRFMDHPEGAVSLVNHASLADLGARGGHTLEPLRFRANLYLEGWPAWSEMALDTARLRIGGAVLQAFKPIVRCAATHVNPNSAQRDFDTVGALQQQHGHSFCGLYLTVVEGGDIAVGDAVEIAP